jgi:hypothetical protein
MHEEILCGMDGANPLGFLAALGVLRVLARTAAESKVCLSWRLHQGAWRPCLGTEFQSTEQQLTHQIAAACAEAVCDAAFALADNLNVQPEEYQLYARKAAASAYMGHRTHAEFAASFACESLTTESGSVQDTALRTMSGAGHQHFLKTMRSLVADTHAAHIGKTLFSPWRYDDPVRNMTLRWDPSDDSRYALRWSDPSGDSDRAHTGAMWGANRLAIEGLPLMPVMPTGRQL